MTMPVLPALMGDKSASAPALSDVLDQLDEDQIAELVATAEAAGFGGDLEAPVPGADDEEAKAEPDDADLEAEPSDEEAEAVGAQGFDEMGAWVTKSLEELGSQVEAISASFDVASDGEEAGAEPEEAQVALDQAEELQARVSELEGEFAAAQKAEDAHAAGVACLRIEKAVRKMGLLVQLAATAAETTDSAEAGVEDEPAVKLWAERTAAKAGPLGVA